MIKISFFKNLLLGIKLIAKTNSRKLKNSFKTTGGSSKELAWMYLA